MGSRVRPSSASLEIRALNLDPDGRVISDSDLGHLILDHRGGAAVECLPASGGDHRGGAAVECLDP